MYVPHKAEEPLGLVPRLLTQKEEMSLGRGYLCLCQSISYIDKLLSTVCHVPENASYGPHITLVVIPAEKKYQSPSWQVEDMRLMISCSIVLHH